MDKDKQVLLEALRQGADGAQEHRLYRSGKLPGLFSGRTTLHSEVADKALREGLLEMVRTETRGKTVVEWVKVTPLGMSFLVEHESPLQVLEELHEALRKNQDGLPAWFAELRQKLEDSTGMLVEEFQGMAHRLEVLSQRVVEALQRAERMGPALPEGSAGALPWGNEAVVYLDRRKDAGLEDRCPLPELFTIVRQKEEALTLRDFHSGLRRLHDRGVIRLLAFEGGNGPPEPEYALLDGAMMYYWAAR